MNKLAKLAAAALLAAGLAGSMQEPGDSFDPTHRKPTEPTHRRKTEHWKS